MTYDTTYFPKSLQYLRKRASAACELLAETTHKHPDEIWLRAIREYEIIPTEWSEIEEGRHFWRAFHELRDREMAILRKAPKHKLEVSRV